jgi:pyruvate kinase
VSLANSLPDAKIVIFTRRGTMADYVSNLRPNAPIYAFSPTYETVRKLVINWGTYPHYLSFDPNPNRTISAAINVLVKQGLAKQGDHLVIVSDMLAGEERFDTIQLRVI